MVVYMLISFVVIACCILLSVTGCRVLADELLPRVKHGDFGGSISTGNGYHAV